MTDTVWLTGSPYKTHSAVHPLRGIRAESWSVKQLALDGSPLGDLDGCTDLKVTWKRDGVRGTGSLTWEGVTSPDWLYILLQPWYRAAFIDGSVAEWPLGVFIPATPEQKWDDGAQTQTVDLYDKLLLLVEAEIDEAYSVAAGMVATVAVRTMLTEVGIPVGDIALTDSTATLAASMAWDAGTSRLVMVNEVLKAINYGPLSADRNGAFVARPYVTAQDRPVMWEFRDTTDGIYAPAFTHARDTFKVPNRVVCISRAEGGFEGLRSEANLPDEHPFSAASRGRMIPRTLTDVDAASQADLDALTARELAEATQVTSDVAIDHWMIPLELDDAAAFANEPADINIRAVVEEITVALDQDGFGDMTTHLREVLA